jgi:hypothetical protein
MNYFLGLEIKIENLLMTINTQQCFDLLTFLV